MKNFSALTPALLSVIALAACNHSSTGPGGGGNTHGTTIDACTLVTESDAAAIMGQAVVSHTDTLSQGYISVCTYYGSVQPGFILPTRLLISAFTTAGMQAHLHTGTAQSYLEGLKTNLPTNFWVDQPGLGNEAIWRNREGKISFYQGDVVVETVYSPHGTGIDTSAAAKDGAVIAATDAEGKL